MPYNNLAWLAATSPRQEFRDGKKAVEYARKACELTNWKEPGNLDTLAAAYAQSGDFQEAIKWQNKALESPAFPKDQVEKAHQRLEMYAAGKPYREK